MIGRRDFRIFVPVLDTFHTRASFFIFFVCFCILFHSSCSHSRVFGKTRVHEFHITYRHTWWYLLFLDSATTSAQCVYDSQCKFVELKYVNVCSGPACSGCSVTKVRLPCILWLFRDHSMATLPSGCSITRAIPLCLLKFLNYQSKATLPALVVPLPEQGHSACSRCSITRARKLCLL